MLNDLTDCILTGKGVGLPAMGAQGSVTPNLQGGGLGVPNLFRFGNQKGGTKRKTPLYSTTNWSIYFGEKCFRQFQINRGSLIMWFSLLI